jgi:rare lipoprotein A (peptidoglycan hydrolase)
VSTRSRARASFRFALLAAGLCLSAGTAYAATTGAANPSAGVTIASVGKSHKVAYGRQVKLAGRVASGAGRNVRLEQAPGDQGWRPVAQTTSGGDGSYAFAVRAERSGSYRAVSEGGTSAPEKVTVMARLAGKATRHVRRGSTVRVRGTVRPARSGRTVRLQRRSGSGWKTVDKARTGRGGSFRAAWHPAGNGAFRLRVRFGGDKLNGAAGHTLRKRVNVYRPALASWYGPGFYGGHLACGGTMSPSKLGVANKSLPCGTKVTLRYHGRSVTVPVVDRGPYSGAREFDLTAATKRKLGFGSTGTVWSTR